MIADFKDSSITSRTNVVVEDYLKIDDEVLNSTQMSAFLLGKIREDDGVRRAETVHQLLQKLREDVTNMRAAIMKQITDICNGESTMYLHLSLCGGTLLNLPLSISCFVKLYF